MHIPVTRICMTAVAAAVLSTGVVGCAHQKGEAAVERRTQAVSTIGDVRDDLQRASAQVAATQQSLDRLSTQQAGDLTQSYNQFLSDINRNRSIQGDLDNRGSALVNDAANHVNQWDYHARTIQNEDLRQQSLEREQQARQEKNQVTRSLDAVRARYAAYIRQLEEVATYAANDLTPRGMALGRDRMQQVNDRAQQLRDEMAQLDQQLSQLATSWQTEQPLAARANTAEHGTTGTAQSAGGTLGSGDYDRSTTAPAP